MLHSTMRRVQERRTAAPTLAMRGWINAGLQVGRLIGQQPELLRRSGWIMAHARPVGCSVRLHEAGAGAHSTAAQFGDQRLALDAERELGGDQPVMDWHLAEVVHLLGRGQAAGGAARTRQERVFRPTARP